MRNVSPLSEWPLTERDVADFDFAPFEDKVDLVSGGPPCQPFSPRREAPRPRGSAEHVPRSSSEAVREVRPRAILVENVKGLLRESFAKYFEYIYLQLSYPEVCLKSDESWQDHLARLEKHHTSGSESGLHYRVVYRLLNAADYGVPQRRERVIIVGIRGDLGIEWGFPVKSHSMDALARDQWVTGEYWERHGVARAKRPEMPGRAARAGVERLRENPATTERPWRTVRDALEGLSGSRPRGRGARSEPLGEPGGKGLRGPHRQPTGRASQDAEGRRPRRARRREHAAHAEWRRALLHAPRSRSRGRRSRTTTHFPRSWTESTPATRERGAGSTCGGGRGRALPCTLDATAKGEAHVDRGGAVQPTGQGAPS